MGGSVPVVSIFRQALIEVLVYCARNAVAAFCFSDAR